MTERPRRVAETWLKLRVKRELNKNALEPVSWEQIDEEVARRKAIIAKQNQFEQEVFDLWYENAVKASKSKLN